MFLGPGGRLIIDSFNTMTRSRHAARERHPGNERSAQELLTSAIPARLAYTGSDGFPRVVPVEFYWNRGQLVIGTSRKAPKLHAMKINQKVALTIDTNNFPPTCYWCEAVIDRIPPEYLEASKKLIGTQEWQAFEAQVRGMYKRMALITIFPEWAKLLDFETRIPSFMLSLGRD